MMFRACAIVCLCVCVCATKTDEQARKKHHTLLTFTHSSSFNCLARKAEAEAIRMSEMAKLEIERMQAEELAEAVKRAENETEQIRQQRAVSVANRKEMLERINSDANEKAKRVAELAEMLEAAKQAAKDAEIRALKAESAVALEEERAKEKKLATKSEIEAAVRRVSRRYQARRYRDTAQRMRR